MNVPEQFLLAVGERIAGTQQGLVLIGKEEAVEYESEAILKVGEVDGVAYSVMLLPETSSPVVDSEELVGLRSLLALVQSEAEYCLLSTAAQLVCWYYSFKYCPRCAQTLELHEDERAKICKYCGHHQYPRISPCIIVLVRNGEKCLLAHAAKFASGRYSTLAGFIEAGESAEQAVHREIMEEVGIKVSNVRYCFSQSWPFPHSFMLGFMADYLEGDITPDGEEILDADWFEPENMPVLPPRFTIARRLINQYLDDIGRDVEPDSKLFFAAE